MFYCIIAWIVWWLYVLELFELCENVRFWNFSRNRLAGRDWPPGDSYLLCAFLVLDEEPPGGTLPTARRRVTSASVSAILFGLPGGDEFPPGDTNQFSLIFMIWDVGEVLVMEKEWLFIKGSSVGWIGVEFHCMSSLREWNSVLNEFSGEFWYSSN